MSRTKRRVPDARDKEISALSLSLSLCQPLHPGFSRPFISQPSTASNFPLAPHPSIALTAANQSARNADAIAAQHEYNFPKIPERKKL